MNWNLDTYKRKTVSLWEFKFTKEHKVQQQVRFMAVLECSLLTALEYTNSNWQMKAAAELFMPSKKHETAVSICAL
jgi:hypothetical protein